MALTITSVSSPIYSKSDNSTIDVMATFNDGRILPYTAAAFDKEAHGQKLWEELVTGQHGNVAPYKTTPDAT